MKTSEFIEKFNDLSFYLKAIDRDGEVWIMWKDCKVYKLSEDAIHSYGNGYGLTADKLELIAEYLNTPVDEREEERKWVVPFGRDQSDDYQHFWAKVTGRFDLSGADDINWNYRINVQFTNSELEDLKHSQPDPIAQAIDLMKEPAPEVEN